MILAIDTSTSMALLALDTGDGVIERRFKPRATQRVIFDELATLLDPDTLHELDGIVVGIGPGSFTGVKIGVMAAKTLAWSREIPIVGVGSLDAVAAATEAPADADSTLVVAVPSTRGEAYIRLYQFADELWQPRGDLVDVRIDGETVENILPEGRLIVSGEAAGMLAGSIRKERSCVMEYEESWYPRTKGVLILGKGRLEAGDVDSPLMLAPTYVRFSQPERLHGKDQD